MIAWPRIDVPYRHYLSQVNGTCSVINSTYLSDINDCVETSPWAYGGKVGGGGSLGDHGLACCYNTNNTVRQAASCFNDTIVRITGMFGILFISTRLHVLSIF